MDVRLKTPFRIPTILLLMALFFTQSAVFSAAATMTNTWYNAKSTRKVTYSEPSSSRQFARTSFSVQLQGASGDLWQVTLWLGSSYTVVSGAGGNISGSLSNNATAFKWDQMGNPDPNAQILTKAWISGIPGGGMRAIPSTGTNTANTEKSPTETRDERADSGSLPTEAALLGESEGTRLYQQNGQNGDVTLYVQQGDILASTSTSASDFNEHGLTLLVSTGSGTPLQAVLLPSGYTPSSSTPLAAVGPRGDLFIDRTIGSRGQDGIFTAEPAKKEPSTKSSQEATQATFPLYSLRR